MADIDPPSFSLGLDFDLDSEPPPAPVTGTSSGNNFCKPAAEISTSSILDGDDDFEAPTVWLPEPAITLKRLRRGPASSAERPKPKEEEKFVADDDIEDFSSEDEQMPDAASKHHNSLCSSSKFPLSGQVPKPFLASQPARPLSEPQKKSVWNPSVSSHNEANSNKLVFPESHVSPLRRFQLIDSDSDEASPSKGPNKVAFRVNLPKRDAISTFAQVGTASAGEWKKTKAPSVTSQADDLWKGIPSDTNIHIHTPVFDEICEEHFRFVKEKNDPHKFMKGCHASTSCRENEVQQFASSDTTIPAHQYYDHEDFRIQQLVHARLPHFIPLSCGNNQGIKQHSASTINYIGQFNHGESSKQGKKNVNVGSSSTKPRKNSRKSAFVDVLEESDNWITPKRPDNSAKDAGKKRVHGVSKSAGHWFTTPDGKRVYVSGNGQESSGQTAYRLYKRESGGFKKSSKKAASKKKATKKKK